VLASNYNGSNDYALTPWHSRFNNARVLAWDLKMRVDDDRYGNVRCPFVIYTVFFAPEDQQSWVLLGQVCFC
jgi:hypothetical protein